MEESNPSAVCECTEKHDRTERRNLMLITSAVLQWMLMLVCIVYLVFLYHQSNQEPTPPKQFVMTDMERNASWNSTKIVLKQKVGNMDVRDGCIEIFSDGYYLLNAVGEKYDKFKTGEIIFNFQHSLQEHDTWKQLVLQDTVEVTLIKRLFRDSKVFITANLTMNKFDVTMQLVYS